MPCQVVICVWEASTPWCPNIRENGHIIREAVTISVRPLAYQNVPIMKKQYLFDGGVWYKILTSLTLLIKKGCNPGILQYIGCAPRGKRNWKEVKSPDN